MKRSFFENISANIAIKIITYLFAFLTIVYAARVLQPEAYGRAAFASTFSGYFIMLANLGMPIYAMRLCAERRENREQLSQTVNELWSISIVLSIFSLAVLLILTVTVPRLREDRLLFFIYGFGILFQAVGFEWLFKGLEKFRFLAVCHLCAKLISFLCLVIFIHTAEQLPLYALFAVTAAYGADLICFFSVRRYADLSFQIYLNREHCKPLFVFFLMSCAVSIYSSLDLTMLGFMKGNYETGLYTVASKGKNVLTLVGGVVWASILPQATELWKEGKRAQFESLASWTLTIVAGIQLLATIFCMLLAKRLVTLIGGASYAGAEQAFRILMLSLVPIGVSNILGGQVLIPTGQEKYLLAAEIVGAAFNFFGNLVIIPLYSIEGAAATTVISECIVTVLCLYYIHKNLKMDFGMALAQKIWRKVRRELISFFIRLRSSDSLPYYCPCCDVHLKKFAEGGYIQRKKIFNPKRYEHIRQDVRCPVCGAIPRHRILALWCEAKKKSLRKADILYFAPERSMMLWLKRNGISVTTADLFNAADMKLDIEDTRLPDGSYDIIFCNHVLEHVDDFRKALREVYRILTPGGSFICSFPMDPNVALLDEDPGIETDEERRERFGQIDHKRVFGMKAEIFLQEAGFEVETINGDDYPDEILPIIGPADYDINVLFRCRKKLHDIHS